MSESQLPPLEEAAALAAGAAFAMSEVSRTPYASTRLNALSALDQELGRPAFPDPASFAHQLIDTYLMCAGDFLCGMQYVIVSETNLQFSSASLARSSCEYAARTAWLAAGRTPDRRRIARALALFEKSLLEERTLVTPDQIARLGKMKSALDRWRHEINFQEREKVPTATALFEALDADGGKETYRKLSSAAHGGLIGVLSGYGAGTGHATYGPQDAWWRVLKATQYGLIAARQSLALRDVEPIEAFVDAWELCAHYTAVCESTIRME